MRNAKICNVKESSHLYSNYWYKDRIIGKYCNKHTNYTIYSKEYLKKCRFCEWKGVCFIPPVIIIFYYSKFRSTQKLIFISKQSIKYCNSIVNGHTSRIH